MPQADIADAFQVAQLRSFNERSIVGRISNPCANKRLIRWLKRTGQSSPWKERIEMPRTCCKLFHLLQLEVEFLRCDYFATGITDALVLHHGGLDGRVEHARA